MRHWWPSDRPLRVAEAGQGSMPSHGSQAWAGARIVNAGATVEISKQTMSPYLGPRLLLLRLAGGPCRLTVTARYNAGAVPIQHSTVLGPGGGWSLTPAGPWSLLAVSLSAQTATVSWAILEHGAQGLHAPYDFVLTGITEGGAGAPGPWMDASDITGPTGGGWAPEDRHQLAIASTGTIDTRLVDETGATTWAQFQVAARATLKHPGRARLQVRNPGGGVVPRGAIFCWTRA